MTVAITLRANRLAAPPERVAVAIDWTVTPEPVDSGMPPAVQDIFAKTLCTLGEVFYAADADAARSATKYAEIEVKRGWSRKILHLFSARSASQVLPAFESGTHDWSSAAQWLIVSEPRNVEAIAKILYQDWNVPLSWPDSLLLIVRAGMDGDEAICYCRDSELEHRFRETLIAAAGNAGVHFEY